MRRPILVVLAVLLAQAPAYAETLFDKRGKRASIQSYQSYLHGVRAKLFDSDEDKREEAFELIEESLENPKLDGDWEFPLELLGDLMLGTALPADADIDQDLQEEGLDLLIKNALNDSFPISRREFALGQLRRVVHAKRLVNPDFREDTFDALSTLSGDTLLVLSHGAVNALGAVAMRRGSRWKETADDAAEILADRMDEDNLELRRIAILETLELLRTAKQPRERLNNLWEELAEAVEDIDSASLQQDLRPRLLRLAKANESTPFASQAEELRDAVKELKKRTKPAKGAFPEILAQLADEQDIPDLEALLARIEKDGRSDPTLRTLGLAAVVARASRQETAPYILRLLLDSLLRQGRVKGSPMMYYRTASQLINLTYAHRGSGKANLPLAQLARLLASTDKPGLVVPVLDEIKSMAMGKAQPVWIGRRMVALLFLQAGDSPNARIRQHALQLLQVIGRAGRNWAIRREVWTRMALLARFARDDGIKAGAQRWLKG
ncbi:MAG: hypothetical protein O7C61_12895 [SAR324 cluster bacterium]|nr:hypothetical protein [SAR324 cluster bacterium]